MGNSFTNTLDEELKKKDSKKYYDLAREQEFSQLLDKEIQLENAKENALKFTDNEMAGIGLNNTGYGSSNQAGIFNSFLNSLVGAKNQTSANINNLNLEEERYNDTQAQNRFNNFSALMHNTNDINELNDLFIDYGYGSLADDGSLTLTNKPEQFSDDDWQQIKAIYRNHKNVFDKQEQEKAEMEEAQKAPVIYTKGEFKNNQYMSDNGKQYYLRDYFIDETDKLFENAENAKYMNGDVIKVTNKYGEAIYVEYKDGGFRFITKKDYLQGARQKRITRSGGKFTEE